MSRIKKHNLIVVIILFTSVLTKILMVSTSTKRITAALHTSVYDTNSVLSYYACR